MAARVVGGARVAVVAVEFGVSVRTVQRIVDEDALACRGRERSSRWLSLEEREQIFAGVCRDESGQRDGAGDWGVIARRSVGRSTAAAVVSAIGRSRPSGALSGRRGVRRRRSWRGVRGCCGPLRRGWGCVGRRSRSRRGCALDYPDDLQMRISHETIYQLAVRAVARRAAPPADGPVCGPAGRTPPRAAAAPRRAAASWTWSRSPSVRREVDDRARAGPLGGRSDASVPAASSAIATLGRAPDALRDARAAGLLTARTVHVTEALKDAHPVTCPSTWCKSLTWDQGKRNGRPRTPSASTPASRSTSAIGIPVGARQQRERQRAAAPVPAAQARSGRVRSQLDLDEIAAELNGRPRMTLAWATPAEKLAELLTVSPGAST